MTLKVMVVDDTIFYRKIIKDVLLTIPGVEVVGTVNSGALALNRIPSLKPDLITLDVEMPGMNGLQVLEEIRKKNYDVTCIMISSKTLEGSTATIKALELGAFDFVPKPDDSSAEANIDYLKTHLEKLIGMVTRQVRFKWLPKTDTRSGVSRAKTPAATSVQTPISTRLPRIERSSAIAIGVSTGGPNALATVLPSIPGDINVPIFLVQHMPPLFSASMAKSLDKKCALRVKEAENGETVEANTVYIAEGGKQMKIASGASFSKIIRITDDPPENNCKPSVDYLFRSVAREYGSKTTCVIMTGMGADGKLGVTVTRAAGAYIIAQNEETCVVYGMPKEVVDAGLADVVCPLGQISAEILKTVKN
ncbi:chemotaxis response regulator protein-glutamate methylesterase [bacterium]|nr:chemotaxis response regulator protein-glutamate methylesterase [bacterium]